jgi:hypothetical protein
MSRGCLVSWPAGADAHWFYERLVDGNTAVGQVSKDFAIEPRVVPASPAVGGACTATHPLAE